MGDPSDAKAAKKRADELLAHDVNERTRKFARRGNAFIVAGLVMFAGAFFAESSPAVVLGAMGALFALLGLRIRRAIAGVHGIRAATEANAKSDHAELERLLRVELGRAVNFVVKLSVIELLAGSLWRRGAIDELDELFTTQLNGKDRSNKGPFAEAYSRTHAFWLLARACRGAASIESEAQQLEAAGALDARGVTRLALARAVCALRAGDNTKALRVLEGFDDLAADVSAEDRALGRALRAYAGRGPTGDGYRAGGAAPTGGAMGQWVAKVFAPAAPFVEEQSLRAIDEPEWARPAAQPPSNVSATRVGKRPLYQFQRALFLLAWLSLIATGALVMDPTIHFAMATFAVTVLSLAGGFGVQIAARRAMKANLLAQRTAIALRLKGERDAASSLLTAPIASRDPIASANASLLEAENAAVSGDLERALSMVDFALGRLAWLPSKGRETMQWANAALMRPRFLAMAGREQEAEAALAFALMSVIEVSAGRGLRFVTRFWLALSLGRRDEAIELARTFDVRTATDGRTELARDAVLAIGDPSAMRRVRERIEAWPAARALFEKVCPWIAEGWASSATGVRVDVAGGEATAGEGASVEAVSDDAQGRGGSTP